MGRLYNRMGWYRFSRHSPVAHLTEETDTRVAGCKKPDPHIYQLACKRLGVTPDACLCVGDGGSRELTGATRVGMQPVLFELPPEEGHETDRPDVREWRGPTITTLRDVLSYVD